MEVINQWIDESDVYLLILGGRYGSIEPKTGKSYIQLEYEYAVKAGKPLFACVIKDEALESRVKESGLHVFETDNLPKLKEFRAIVLTKMVKFWEDLKDIKIAVGETLAHFSRKDDLVGWIRASQEANVPALADEMARLSQENARLRSRIQGAESALRINGLSFSELKTVLESKALLRFFEKYRLDLGGPYGLDNLAVTLDSDTKQIEELILLGLVKQEKTTYKLSENGRIFLNRLTFEELAPRDGKVATDG